MQTFYSLPPSLLHYAWHGCDGGFQSLVLFWRGNVVMVISVVFYLLLVRWQLLVSL